jgi:urea carboxylase
VSETEEEVLEEEVLPKECEAVSASLPGSVWKILVKENDVVEKGQEIAVLESMKMEFPVEAEVAGTVKKVYVKAGQQINAGQMLAAISV